MTASPRLVYLANNRLPTEKAHGLQIVQMCEALAGAGYDVTLVTSRRRTTRALRGVRDLWAYYGVARNFVFRRLPCLDLIDLTPLRWQKIPFALQTLTYLIALALWLAPRRVDVIFTRDVWIAALARIVRPRAAMVYEVHQLHHSGPGRRVQAWVLRRACAVPVTAHLADALRKRGAARIQVEHDGVRLGRFEGLPTRVEARAALGLPVDAVVLGYVGQVHTMRMGKGLDTLIDAVALAARGGTAVDLLLVGGPQAGIDALRAQWIALGLDAARLHAVGQVPPGDVPRTLAAIDIGALPLPWTEHFAYYASAIKLFEYMAAGCAVLASDLPSTAEVVRDGESALLCPPGDVAAFAAAITRLVADPALRDHLATQARRDVQYYTWAARAARIRAFVEEGGGCASRS